MSQVTSSNAGQSKEWLPPSAALERFTPPGDLLWSDVAPLVERKRYGYRVGSMNLLIKAEVGSEVIRPQTLAPLPGDPDGDFIRIEYHRDFFRPYFCFLHAVHQILGIIVGGHTRLLCCATNGPN